MTTTPTNVLASVDLGSNSFRLQVCENNNGQLKVIDSFKQMVRFAAGLDEHKNLDEASQERALDCLAKFGERLRGFKPEQVRVVATNTFRVAKNIAQFLPKAEAALGFPIEIIAGREEARLIYTGVVHTLPPNGDAGFLAHSIAAFEKYQRENAWTWEHQSLTRARFICGTPDVQTAWCLTS